MSVTIADLKVYVGTSDNEYDDLLQSCLDEATALVDKYNIRWDATAGEYVASAAPTVLVDKAYLEVAAGLFDRRNAPNGILSQQFATADGVGSSPVRIQRDPMAPAYRLLNRWVLPW